MEDQKLLTAILTALVALLLGLTNLIFNIFSLKSKNRNEKEVEKLKSDLQKERIRFEEALKKDESTENIKSETAKRILNTFQVLKDSSYSLINNLNQTEDQYKLSLENYKVSLSSVIGVYQETYMELEDELRQEIHEIKNFLHYVRVNTEKELLKFAKEIKEGNRMEKKEIENLIGKISIIQNKLLSTNA
ncbi:MAG: hypothetical protein GC192_24740 [Bacteroidetes bacterium]|nr:hypothetical protein [Bacteroidota bacterium]